MSVCLCPSHCFRTQILLHLFYNGGINRIPEPIYCLVDVAILESFQALLEESST